MIGRRLLIRCDGGSIPEIGTGHVRRSLWLADFMRRQGDYVAFAMKEDSERMRMVRARGFRVYELDVRRSETREVLAACRDYRAETLVVDRLNAEGLNLSRLKANRRMVVLLDAAGARAAQADLSINSIVPSPAADYAGSEYIQLPLRRRKPKNIRRRGSKVFVSFGGYDPNALMPKALKALSSSRLVKGVWAAGTGEGVEVPDYLQKRVRFVQSLHHIDELLASQVDLAVVSGGLILYQALSLGVPCIALNQYAHQEDLARRLGGTKTLINLGQGCRVPSSRIRKTAHQVLQDYDLRRSLSRRAYDFVDRLGVSRVAAKIGLISSLPWDTRHFGARIATVTVNAIRANTGRLILEYARRGRIHCLYFRTQSRSASMLRWLKKQGFVRYGVQAYLSWTASSPDTPLASDGKQSDSVLRIKKAGPKDAAVLKALSTEAFGDSRFFRDEHFARSKANRMFQIWVQKTLLSSQGRVWKAMIGHQTVGYVSVMMEQGSRASLELLRVHEHAQGRGVGTALLRNVIQWARDNRIQRIRVVAQAENARAMAVYQRMGFGVETIVDTYHKWFYRGR